MIALAWQTNRTRVATMKMVEEASMRTYPNLDVHEAFHPTSHWGGFPDRVANLRLIQNYHTAVFAKFVRRLNEMPDGNGSVLDHSIILFGSNMANSDAHNNDPLPQALIGRGGGVKGGQHLHYPQDTPHANILVTMLHRAGVPAAGHREIRRQHRRLLGSVIMKGCPILARTIGCHVPRAARWVAAAALVAVLPGAAVARKRQSAASTARKVDPSRRTEDVNRRNADGSTPLQWAVYAGDVAEVKRLLRAGADVSLANNYGATPMSLAAEVGNTEMLKVLLEVGANADSPNPDGQTALLAVARTGNVEAAQLLLNHGATVDAREKWGGQTALMWASARRHPEMMQLLISKGADVNARSIDRNYQRHVTAEGRPKSLDSGGLTPLLYAARENCMACVEVLLENGADIDLPDPDGVSPLLVAIMNANWDLARQLILAGADVNQWDIYGEAPLFTAIDLRSRIDGGRASIDPLNKTDGLTIVKVLLERGADPNMQLFFKPANVRGATNTRGATPLIRAANNGDLEVVKLLLEHGADATRLHGGPADADPCGARGPLLRAAGAGTDPRPAEGWCGRQRHRPGQPRGGDSGRHGAALRRPQALQRGHQGCSPPTAST